MCENSTYNVGKTVRLAQEDWDRLDLISKQSKMTRSKLITVMIRSAMFGWTAQLPDVSGKEEDGASE